MDQDQDQEAREPSPSERGLDPDMFATARPAKRFPTRMRAASILPRWSLIWTVNRDTVSSHSFFVAYYAYEIASLLEWDGPMEDLLLKAILHDMDELVTGDIVAPVKRRIIDETRAKEFVHAKMRELVPRVYFLLEAIDAGSRSHEIDCILKAADRLDAMFFAQMEVGMGNRVIASRLPLCYEKLVDAWFDLPARNEFQLQRLWDDHIKPAIQEHGNPAAYDIDKPRTEEDEP